MKIEAEVVRNRKNWFARVIGLSARYGVDVEFAEPTEDNGSVKRYTITEPGVYKHPARDTTILSMRRDTGYVRVDGDGSVTEISEEEAKEWAAS